MKLIFNAAALLATLAFLYGCSALGEIFDAGMWTGLFIAMGILSLAVVIFFRVFRN